jgi:hypothetical protein
MRPFAHGRQIMNKDGLIAFLFWFTYHEIIVSIVSYGTGFSWWILQIPAILLSVVITALTYGSQTKPDREWYEND